MTTAPLPDGTSPNLTVSSGSQTRRPTVSTESPSEREFSDSVAEVAHLYGWRIAHFRPARTVHGWRTPAQYDGAGFPDCVLVQPVRGLTWFRELKAGKGRLNAAQQDWRNWLNSAGANFDVWRPADFDDIVAALSNGKAVLQ